MNTYPVGRRVLFARPVTLYSVKGRKPSPCTAGMAGFIVEDKGGATVCIASEVRGVTCTGRVFREDFYDGGHTGSYRTEALEALAKATPEA